MSEYKRQILSGCLIAVILAIGLGASIYYNFPLERGMHAAPTTTPTSTYIHPGTTTTKLTVTTARFPAFYMDKVVEFDPRLKIESCNTILFSDNATKIAESLAKALGEAPIKPISSTPSNSSINMAPSSIVTTTVTAPQPTVTPTFTTTVPPTTQAVTVTVVTSVTSTVGETILQHTKEYVFKTAKNSTIDVILIDNRFYQLTYTAKERIDIKVEVLNPNFNPVEKIEYAKKVVDALGIAQDLLDERYPKTLNPNIFQICWTQKYRNVTIGTLVRDWAGNPVMEQSIISFTFYPETGKLVSLTIISPYWYTVPSNFPINISPNEAASIAKDYITKYTPIKEITSTQTNFIVIKDHLYYIVTLDGDKGSYHVIVNPRTGEVGFPEKI